MPEKLVHHASGLPVHRRRHVAVGVECDRHGGVPKHVADHLRMYSTTKEQRGGSMPRIVKPDWMVRKHCAAGHIAARQLGNGGHWVIE